MEPTRTVRVLLLTDNEALYHGFQEIERATQWQQDAVSFTYCYSPNSHDLHSKYQTDTSFSPLDVRANESYIIDHFDLVISLHCKQIFPSTLVSRVRCVNVHPGYNPHNRGWFPHVFSIVNGKPAGVTIHVMDDKVDHGPIICREQISISDWQTSADVYRVIQSTELRLIGLHLKNIVYGQYQLTLPEHEGNVNTSASFRRLCALDMDEQLTMGDAINRLRALTHGSLDNAYFIDHDGNRVLIKITLQVESKQAEGKVERN